ncbi:MAG: LuxR family transcriptional regulator [Candidatus Dormibacteraeota bacterium]|nr:LuxR family transcriptional regulator [Candidatus Dormibacteraeota bacterium]
MDAPPTGTVTFLLTDMEGSVQLWERQPEVMKAVQARHDELLRSEIEKRNGVVIRDRGEGDSFFAVFANASEALATAVAIQLGLAAVQWPEELSIRVRIGINSGEAEFREGDYYGAAINRCARIRAAAHGEQVLLGAATEKLVADHLPSGVTLIDLGEHRLRDMARPERIFQLSHPDLRREFPPPKTLETAATNLPLQLTSFIGREADLAEIRLLLGQTRLLTLVGAGGSGKTRLALELGAEVLDSFPDGVWFVELSPIADGALIPSQVATAAGIREEPGRALQATLVERLGKSQTLIVLDNCEHLLESTAGMVEALLRGSAHLSMVATSQEVLHAEGEVSWRVPSLDEELCLRLFVERARQVNPHFELGDRAETVTQICRRLDGIPLAIELAAARVAVLSPAEILERLDDRFRLLTGGRGGALPRQKTLRAALDWSYGLLSEAEQTLLARLSVFVGGWSLQSAEAVCSGGEVAPAEVLDLLSRLIDKSLVVTTPAEPGTRYKLLDTMRQYAFERLVTSGDAEAIQLRHAEHFAATEVAVTGRLGPSGLIQLRTGQSAEEVANLRAALQFVRRKGPALALRVATQLSPLLRRDGHLREGRNALKELLAAWPAVDEVRLRALLELRIITYAMGEFEFCLEIAREALQVAEALGEPGPLNEARIALALSNRVMRRFDEATEYFKAALESVIALGDEQAAEHLRSGLAMTALLAGDPKRARALLDDVLGRHSQDSDVRLNVLSVLSIAELVDGNAQHARDHLLEVVRGGIANAARTIKINGIEVMAAIELDLGHPEASLRLAGAAEAFRREDGSVLSPLGVTILQPYTDRARARFDSDRTAVLLSEGGQMSLEEALQYFLEEHTS